MSRVIEAPKGIALNDPIIDRRKPSHDRLVGQLETLEEFVRQCQALSLACESYTTDDRLIRTIGAASDKLAESSDAIRAAIQRATEKQ